MHGLQLFFEAVWALSSWQSLFNTAWAVLLGIVVGALPGLTATMGVALLTTLTYKMAPDQAILTLICMYVGAIYGGSRTAILLNIPGTPASAATTLDGYPLAKAGRAGEAMGIATTSSAIGTVIGTLFLAAWRRCSRASRSISIPTSSSGSLCSASSYRASSRRRAPRSRDTSPAFWVCSSRWSAWRGSMRMSASLSAERAQRRHRPDPRDGRRVRLRRSAERDVFASAWRYVRGTVDRVVPRFTDIWRYKVTALRSGVIGTFIGIIPGVGEDIGAWASYAAARRASKTPEEFGKGSIDGLTAAETGDNAVVPGALIPTLDLAVPGSAPAAVLIAALFIHGVRPGPMIMIEQPVFVYSIVAMLFFATIGICVFGLALTRPLLYVLRIPRERLMPIVFVLCVIGPYALTQRMFDIWVDAVLRHRRLRCCGGWIIRWRRWCSASSSATSWTRTCAAA